MVVGWVPFFWKEGAVRVVCGEKEYQVCGLWLERLMMSLRYARVDRAESFKVSYFRQYFTVSDVISRSISLLETEVKILRSSPESQWTGK